MLHINEDKPEGKKLLLENPLFFFISLTIVFIISLLGSLFLSSITIIFIGNVMFK